MCNNTRNIILRAKSEESLKRHSELSWIFKRPAVLQSLRLAGSKKAAFTLAEVLITLAIIGVVAALTMPIFMSFINEKQYNSGRLKALSMIGEAGKRISALGEMNSNYNAQEFINNTLKKYITITKICPSGKFQDCGWADSVKSINGNKLSWKSMPTQANQAYALTDNSDFIRYYLGSTSYISAFTTSNGYSFILFYYPYCKNAPASFAAGFRSRYTEACMHTLYDMNGKHGPNQFGKDIGIVTVFFPDETVTAIAPWVDSKDSEPVNYNGAINYCKSRGKNYYVPGVYELYSINFVQKLANLNSAYYYWTSDKYRGSSYLNGCNFIISGYVGHEYVRGGSRSGDLVRCIKR